MACRTIPSSRRSGPRARRVQFNGVTRRGRSVRDIWAPGRLPFKEVPWNRGHPLHQKPPDLASSRWSLKRLLSKGGARSSLRARQAQRPSPSSATKALTCQAARGLRLHHSHTSQLGSHSDCSPRCRRLRPRGSSNFGTPGSGLFHISGKRDLYSPERRWGCARASQSSSPWTATKLTPTYFR
jgi:hypothetical protein